MKTFLLIALIIGTVMGAKLAQSDENAPPALPPIDGSMKNASGPTNTLPDLSKEHLFDGIAMAKYAKFRDKWKLITVRYRKDNGEQRFVYANDLAYNAMKAGVKKYPDGAMFGKIAFNVLEDKAFPNSLEPRGYTRIQLMKKDSTKYPESNGWGYGLYTYGVGVPYKSEKTTVLSCHACHTLVPARDYVFSQSAFMGGWNSIVDESFYSRFTEVPVASLSHFSKAVLKETRAHFSDQSHIKLQKMSLFDGSVNESISPVIEYAKKDRVPFLLVDEKSSYFIAAFPTPEGENSSCPGEIKVARLRNLHSNHTPVVYKQGVDHAIVCGDKITWEGTHVNDQTPEKWTPPE